MTVKTPLGSDPITIMKRLQKLDHEITQDAAKLKQLIAKHRNGHKALLEQRARLRAELDELLAAADLAVGAKASTPAPANGHSAPIDAIEERASALLEPAPEAEAWSGQRVRQLQALLGLSNDDLALRVGVSAAAVTNWRNDVNVPVGKNAAALEKLWRETKGVTV